MIHKKTRTLAFYEEKDYIESAHRGRDPYSYYHISWIRGKYECSAGQYSTVETAIAATIIHERPYIFDDMIETIIHADEAELPSLEKYLQQNELAGGIRAALVSCHRLLIHVSIQELLSSLLQEKMREKKQEVSARIMLQ